MRLERYPRRKHDLLQAWDSADELLLDHLGTLDLSGQRVIILNDSFGALACALEARARREGFELTTYTDSYLGHRALQLNSGGRLGALSRLEDLAGPYDLAIARIPKNLSFFDDELCHLSRHLRPGARLVCGYMLKHQASSAFDLLGQRIGATTTSLARKKARLIFARLERDPTASPYPREVRLDGFDRPFLHHSNLFSRERLDIGTRFLLEHVPQGIQGSILDLGCANGVVGIAARLANPSARLVFCDESRMAVESARANYVRWFGADTADTSAEFHWTHCHEGGAPGSLELVLCNPPFHQGNAIGDHIAWQMFQDARRSLVPGGVLRVIGNSHLRYGSLLGRIFGGQGAVTQVARNAKFEILDAVQGR